MIWEHGKAVVEALLLAAPEPLSVPRLAELLGVEEREVRLLLDDLRADCRAPGRGVQVREVAGGFQLVTKPDFADYVEKLLQPRPRGLSAAALETLAIIAYRQPITRAEIEAVRGVNVDGVVSVLVERGLVRELGRKEAPGRPLMFGTSQEFLSYFGLKSLDDLPPVEPAAQGGSLVRRLREQAAEPEPATELAAEEVEGMPAVQMRLPAGGDEVAGDGEAARDRETGAERAGSDQSGGDDGAARRGGTPCGEGTPGDEETPGGS